MSKDSSAGGGASIGFQELLRTNPELLEQMLQGSLPAAAQPGQPGQPGQEQQAEPAVIRTTTPDAIQSFYGSGDRIVQPDQSYYQEFALPGVQMERPVPAPVPDEAGAAEETMTTIKAETGGAPTARANGLPAAVSRDEMQARYEANMARRAAMGIDNSPRSGFFTSGFMPGDPGYEEALAAAPPAAGGLFSGRTNMSPEQIAQAKAAQAARRNSGGSGGLLGFGGQPTEEDLRFAASMPILDAADGRYAPYMNFRGGMR